MAGARAPACGAVPRGVPSLGPVSGGRVGEGRCFWHRSRGGRQGAPQHRPPPRAAAPLRGARVTGRRPPRARSPGSAPAARALCRQGSRARGRPSWSPERGARRRRGLRPGERGVGRAGVRGRTLSPLRAALLQLQPPVPAPALPSLGLSAPRLSSRLPGRRRLHPRQRPSPAARPRGLRRRRRWVSGPLSRGISWSEEELSK